MTPRRARGPTRLVLHPVTHLPTPDIWHVHKRMPALLLSRDLEAWLTGPPEVAQGVAVTSWPTGVLEVQAV